MQRNQSIFVKLKSVDYQYITKTTYSGFYPDCSENDNKQMAKKVFVSGCYDLLHSGHVEFFQQASQYGDLYVGIGSDATYLEYKHRKPMFPQEERLFMVKNDRLAGGVIMNYIQPRLVLLACAILTFVATLIVVVCSGTLSLIAFFALYLGESIMFPTIFSLALRDAGTKTKLASSLLIMTIVGGAVAPVIMGYIADTTGSMAIAFLIPLVCYGVIGTYALSKRHVPL